MWREKRWLDLIIALLGATAGYLLIYGPDKSLVATLAFPALAAWCVLNFFRRFWYNLFHAIFDYFFH